MSKKDKTSASAEVPFKLPRMGESITEGTIINWLVQPGESFEEGDIIVEVGTDKVDNEVPAPFSGTLIETKYNAKDVVKIGAVIAILQTSEGQSKPQKKEKREEKQEVTIEKRETRNKKQEIKKTVPAQTFVNRDMFISP